MKMKMKLEKSVITDYLVHSNRPKRKLSSNSQATSEVTAGSRRSRMPYHSSRAMLSFQPSYLLPMGKALLWMSGIRDA